MFVSNNTISLCDKSTREREREREKKEGRRFLLVKQKEATLLVNQNRKKHE
jgi:hypothetical protein